MADMFNIKDLLGIKSPSKLFRNEIGTNLALCEQCQGMWADEQGCLSCDWEKEQEEGDEE